MARQQDYHFPCSRYIPVPRNSSGLLIDRSEYPLQPLPIDDMRHACPAAEVELAGDSRTLGPVVCKFIWSKALDTVAVGSYFLRHNDTGRNPYGGVVSDNILEDAMAEHSEVLGLAAQIVSAHVSYNAVPSDQLPGLIRQVFNSLATAEQATTVPPKPESAVTVRQSVTAGHIVCLDCGKHFSMLKRHLMTDHKLTPEQYRQRWELPRSYPLVAPNYAKTRSALAKKIGLGRKGSAPIKTERKAARKTAARR
jgi:predicted transcriptional regulator